MFKLIPSKDAALILSFIKGPALLKRCMGGVETDVSNLKRTIEESKSVFLVAVEDGKGLGFVTLNPQGPGAASIHLCLRTVGEKTKKIFQLAIMYAQHVMGVSILHAVFPEQYRGCMRLAKFFRFKDDFALKDYYKIKSSLPYVYKRLDLY